MTLRQEAHAMINLLPNDDSVRFFIEMIRQFNVVMSKTGQTATLQTSSSEKRQAFLRMEELKKQYPFPKDYDYEQVRKETMLEKYGSVD